MSNIEAIGTIVGITAVVSGFLFWHFKTINGFKDEIHQLKLDMKDLEKKDESQQQTIDQPLLKRKKMN